MLICVSHKGGRGGAHIVAPQRVLGECTLDPHLHHLERPPQYAAEHVGVGERGVLLRKLNELGERIVAQLKAEFRSVGVDHLWKKKSVGEELR